MSEALHVKYRPETLDEVIGQKSAVSALESIIKRKKMQAFLFSGPSGCGKTTLARIAASELGCVGSMQVLEVDAATNNGIDAMRAVQEMMGYRGFGKEAGRCAIIDEAHRLSPNAWDSLLKAIEEPAQGVYWFFCTTNPAKLPKTIKTRCAAIAVSSVSDRDLERLVQAVCAEEKLKTPDSILQYVVREAHGSPRQALVNLETVAGCREPKEAARILRTVVDSDPILELCRFLVAGGSWAKAMAIIAKLEDESPESVRIVVCNYLASCLKGAKGDKQALAFLELLEQFSTPYNQSENMAPLYLSIGRALFAGN